ncbi:uncharacterized protein LOC113963758 [Neopelma chrysocephalum]|uniref:uncharacterized protein LOC113963758 n=1 Tax=Neopelma chrysocephalum TaxID=114329 RepID=UPI000FCCFCB4|nr:uncharacterized protein LOC113963758 [Neopelma chrysocephalum]
MSAEEIGARRVVGGAGWPVGARALSLSSRWDCEGSGTVLEPHWVPWPRAGGFPTVSWGGGEHWRVTAVARHGVGAAGTKLGPSLEYAAARERERNSSRSLLVDLTTFPLTAGGGTVSRLARPCEEAAAVAAAQSEQRCLAEEQSGPEAAARDGTEQSRPGVAQTVPAASWSQTERRGATLRRELTTEQREKSYTGTSWDRTEPNPKKPVIWRGVGPAWREVPSRACFPGKGPHMLQGKRLRVLIPLSP